MSGAPDEREVRVCLRTPLTIEMLIHYAVSAEQHPNRRVAVYREAMIRLEEAGAVEPTETGWSSEAQSGNYKITPLGRAWVNALCLVPPPKCVFLDEAGRDVS